MVMLDILPQLRTLAKEGQNSYLGLPLDDPEEPLLVSTGCSHHEILIVRQELNRMEDRVSLLKQATHEKLHSIDPRRQTGQVEALLAQVNQTASYVQERLKNVGTDVKSLDQVQTVEDRIAFNIHGALVSQFVLTMQRYQEIQNVYNERSREILITQIKLKNPHATEAEIQAKIESGDAQLQISSQKLDLANESHNYVTARHQEILKLEKSLQEVHSLFNDLAVLVDAQGDCIDRIAYRVTNAKQDLAEAKVQLTVAQTIRRRTLCVVQ